MLDETDRLILALLKENAKLPLHKIGEEVHMTSQAVSNRIIRLQKLGIISRYTIELGPDAIEPSLIAFVTVFMKTTNHPAFIHYLRKSAVVIEAHKISGDGCYLLKLQPKDMDELNVFLEGLLEYGNYRLNLSTSQVK